MKEENALIRIVDDDASVRDALVYMLEQEGFDTVAYASAEEFLVNDMPSRPGVVVLDVRMPGMSGTRLQDEMIERRIDTPIIFLTGHGDVDMAVKADAENGTRRPVKLRTGVHIDGGAALLDAMTVRQKYYSEIGDQLKNGA